MELLFSAAVRHIMEEIEIEVLRRAFGQVDSNPFYVNEIPLENHIERIVILESVVKDIQLFDSVETSISLSGLPVRIVNDNYNAVFIPPERRGGRDIMGCLAITFSNGSTIEGENTPFGGNNMTSSSGAILNALSRQDSNTDHDVSVIPPNTIMFNRRRSNYGDIMAHVQLSVDSRMSHIRNATSLDFIELCVWKARQLCYTRLNIAIGQDLIHNGVALGVFADAIREYRDAYKTYKDLRRDFRTTLRLNDPNKRRRMIRARMPKILG